MILRSLFLAAALLAAADARAAAQGGDPDAAVRAALEAHLAAMQSGDVDAAGEWLATDFFYVAPWGALEFRPEMLERMRDAFAAGRLRNYRVSARGFHAGPAGDGGRWFRTVVRETYERPSGRQARNAFAEDLLTTGVAVLRDGRWRIAYLQQTWSDETLRRMVPILHAAQPVDPEEY
ncbi:MAG TPA: nuclear transport factor 2 family protein [Gemmatimonadota bacterium]